MTKKKTTKFLLDKRLLITTFTLLILGLLLVFSASSPEAVLKHGDGYFFVKKHVKFLGLGLFVMFFASNINYKLYKKFAIPIILIAIFLNLLLYTKLGKSELGQTRWLGLPYLPRFMPSDTLKPAAVIFLAYYLEKIGPRIKKPKGVIITTLLILFFVGLVFMKDMGSALVILISLGCMLLISEIKLTALGVLIVLGFFTAKKSLGLEIFQYRMDRLTSFLNPFENMQGDGMQQGNSIYSVALGGITGVGLGKGFQKFSYIPHVYNDFIFSVMAEEFGLIGGVFLVSLFVYYTWVAFDIAKKCKSIFGKFLAIGLSSLILVQAFVHIFVNIGLAPVTGITLPFISYGGTSLVITMFMTGIILNISKENNRRR
ncbi:MAG: putative peptidoglycan glycosyltransferase FtsW [Bacillota bacterium]|nr:putative peptidoglycan glycosyltransferase FtsW [Bacillota bacterium]